MKENRSETIKKSARSAKDTGSPEVQVSLLTQTINHVTSHLKTHKKDFCSEMGLKRMVGQRKRLLAFLKRSDEDRYLKLIKDLGLRK